MGEFIVRFRKIWPVAFILVIWFIFASPFFLKGRIPFPSTYLVSFFPPWSATYGMPVKNNAMPDVITQIYPWKRLTIDSWKLRQIPLWNPYSFSGTPHAGNYQSAVFSPLNLLFFIFNETAAWSILVLLQPILAAVFAFLLLRALNRSPVASVLGAMSFMFCGFLVTWMAYGTLGYAALYLPLILWGIQQKKGIAITTGIFLSFTSGHFQISLYVLGASLLYAIWKRRWHTLVFVLLGLLLAAPQLYAAYRSYAQSIRSSLFMKGEIIPWNYLITALVPDFFGNPVTRNDWFGHYAEWASYIGVIPILFAVFGLTKKKTREQWFFITLAVCAIVFAYPTLFSDALFRLQIPVLSTSAASRIIILFSFSLSMLSAYGLDAAIDSWKEKKKYTIRFEWITLGVLAVFWIGMRFGHLLSEDKLAIAQRNSVLPSALVVLWCLIVFFARYTRKIPYIIASLLLLTSIDMLRFAGKWMPFDPQEYVYPETNLIRYLKDTVGQSRIYGNFGGEMSTYFGFQTIEGYDAVYQKRYGEFVAAASNGVIREPERSVVLLGKKAMYAQRVLDILGVKYLVHRLSDGRNVWAYPYWEYPQYKSVYKDDQYEVLENTEANPRFYLVSHYVKKTVDQEIISTLFDPSFDAKNSVILETDPEITPEEGNGTLEIVSYTPNELIFKTSADKAKLLVVSDVFDSGWIVTIDKVKTSLYRANYDFRAVALPEGTHTVRMFYQL